LHYIGFQPAGCEFFQINQILVQFL